MNIVFYVIVLVVLLFVYYLLSTLFRGIGGIALRMWEEFKENIMGDKEDE